jgi:RNA polymerase sigma factor (TIGR02999 family)
METLLNLALTKIDRYNGSPMAPTTGEITKLLSKFSAGDANAEHEIFLLVYNDLRRLARQFLRAERPDHTLQATALVNEAYLRIFQSTSPFKLHNRSHLLAVLARAMRRVLVDHARGRHARKRAGVKISLESALVFTPEESGQLVALDQALQRLAAWAPRQAKVVEMKFFGGLLAKEIAAELQVSEKTVKRDWNLARAWLYGELTKTEGNE